jgi:hypothetical protein
MNIFVSCLTYGLGKALGIPGAARAFSRQLVDSEMDPSEVLPAARLIHRLRDSGDLIIYHGAGTALPKARSRAAHAALESKADYWVMVDDDVEADIDTCRRMLVLATGCCSVLPCAIRGTDSERFLVNLVWDGPLISLHYGEQARTVRRAGCGLMMLSRAALIRVTDEASAEHFIDDDGVEKVALFQQMFVAGDEGKRLWLNEDYSFCERLRAAGVTILAPVSGRSSHDGTVIDLAEAAKIG